MRQLQRLYVCDAIRGDVDRLVTRTHELGKCFASPVVLDEGSPHRLHVGCDIDCRGIRKDDPCGGRGHLAIIGSRPSRLKVRKGGMNGSYRYLTDPERNLRGRL